MPPIAAILAAAVVAGAQPPIELGPVLAQTRAFASSAGDKLWPGYGAAPFGFLLVGGDRETLLCNAIAPSGFQPDGLDAATGCTKSWRPRSGLPDTLLAAMPMFGPQAVIVMGPPGKAVSNRGAWIRTILHEHFHQWEWELPDHYKRVDALGLAGGDKTGLWMLNYPFPYSDAKVAAAYATASNAVADSIAARGTAAFIKTLDRYLAARTAFAATVSPKDWTYLELELWQEGVARWTEVTLGERYPDAEVRTASAHLEKNGLDVLRRPDLKEQGRELVYPYGAGEAMLLEACDPTWRTHYSHVLAMGPLLEAARRQCDGR